MTFVCALARIAHMDSLFCVRVFFSLPATGDEQDYIILSTVRSLPSYELERNPSEGWMKKHRGFITDQHQINVALTRAKKGLIIVGECGSIGQLHVVASYMQLVGVFFFQLWSTFNTQLELNIDDKMTLIDDNAFFQRRKFDGQR